MDFSPFTDESKLQVEEAAEPGAMYPPVELTYPHPSDMLVLWRVTFKSTGFLRWNSTAMTPWHQLSTRQKMLSADHYGDLDPKDRGGL